MSDNPFRNHSIEELELCIASALEKFFKGGEVSVVINSLALGDDIHRHVRIDLQAWHSGECPVEPF